MRRSDARFLKLSIKFAFKNHEFCQIETGSYLIGVFVISELSIF